MDLSSALPGGKHSTRPNVTACELLCELLRLLGIWKAPRGLTGPWRDLSITGAWSHGTRSRRFRAQASGDTSWISPARGVARSDIDAGTPTELRSCHSSQSENICAKDMELKSISTVQPEAGQSPIYMAAPLLVGLSHVGIRGQSEVCSRALALGLHRA